ncbi:MAG TPA: bifunctional proline dehydrogenase/L-glutamate gamma-semialdehyde dehydrogenase, partial [Rhodospirillales bacterium]|nr:bifunctional proline dehydrogenase/L-glutamate gamma-semialdehyde dehydrogenase [Rhodospirillales bacterium]
MTAPLRQLLRAAYLPDEAAAVSRLAKETGLDGKARDHIVSVASDLVADLRSGGQVGLMETFLAEYGLSSMEGVALMCLAEALLRVPDDITIDALIRDKIAPSDWAGHRGGSESLLVNASTWALMLTGKVIGGSGATAWDIRENLLSLVRRAGEPVIRTAVTQAMKILGHQFVLGRNIDEAMMRAEGMIDQGYTYSYDMLGEAARTASDARRYFMAYCQAIMAISGQCKSHLIYHNSGISVKLSALHPRYELAQRNRVLAELVPRVGSLALIARNAGMGFTIDAEEADRLDLSLDVIERVLASPDLKGWDGFGVVVQAYMARATFVIDWLYDLAERLDRRIMVRLVKGAYWDSEIKNAQVEGLAGYPVFTRKASTDICYLACVRRLLAMTGRIYPQFAT